MVITVLISLFLAFLALNAFFTLFLFLFDPFEELAARVLLLGDFRAIVGLEVVGRLRVLFLDVF